MKSHEPKATAFTLVEILIATALIGVASGVAIVAVGGVREQARETRLRNDVTVLNNGIDAYVAAGGSIPSGATAEEVVAKLKTVADPETSTSLGPPGPFIDPRMQVLRQSVEEGLSQAARADYPNSDGYFFVRQGGLPGIKEFIQGSASPTVTEARQGSMPYTPGGEFLTDYTDRPAGVPPVSSTPQATPGEDDEEQPDVDLVKLPRPSITARPSGSTGSYSSYGGESVPLLQYPMQVRVGSAGSIGGGQLQVSVNGGDYTSVADPYFIAEVDPKTLLVARLASTDASRYVTSDPVGVEFRAQPVTVFPIFPASDAIPPTMTYAEAGGAMEGRIPTVRSPVVVRLQNIEQVPPKYRTSAYLNALFTKTTTARYTGLATTVTNETFASPLFTPVTNSIDVAGFGANTRMRLYASVESFQPEFVVSAEPLDKTTEIAPTSLAVDIFPLKPIGLPPSVTITHSGDVPVGMRKVYTLTTGSSGAAPLSPEQGGIPIQASVLYSAPITNYPIATYTVVAQATGPAGTEHWFTSSRINRTYIAITRVPLNYIGLNMYKANINGYVKGSIYMQAGDFAVLNAGATIDGNVYVPGTPAVELPAGVEQGSKTVARRNQSYDPAEDPNIETNRITGREYDTEGRLADPQEDLRKIVDLYGSFQPGNYEVRINNTARIDGKLYRRADPPPVADRPPLPAEIALSNTVVNVSSNLFLDAGSYAVTLSDSNSLLQLGSPGTLTKYVFGPGSTWTAGRVEILGPVQIFLNSPTSFGGVTFGSSNTIYQTGFVVMSNYSVSIDNGAVVYGQFEARDSTISVGSGGGQTIKGSLFGSVFANTVSVDGSGFVDVSGGSDTNSVTPGPSPTPTPVPTPTPRSSPTPSPTP